MKYIKIIESVLSRFDYFNYHVEKIKGMRIIIVSFPSKQDCVTQTLLSCLMSIDGLRLISINFNNRRLLFSY